MIAGGSIPGYSEYLGKMSAEEYVECKVLKGELHDKALNAHLLAGGHEVRGVHYGYIEDEQSLGYSTHLVMPNTKYRAKKRALAGQSIKRTLRRARICAVQYEMRKIKSWEELCEQVEYFVDTADLYDSHLPVFPELFIAQMLSTFDRTTPCRSSFPSLLPICMAGMLNCLSDSPPAGRSSSLPVPRRFGKRTAASETSPTFFPRSAMSIPRKNCI